MRFRNYCVIILGDTQNVNDEIRKIAEVEPNLLAVKGITIATFTAFVSPSELKEWFKQHGRNVIVFDLDENSSGVHFTKPDIQKGLFGFIEHINLDEMNQQFLDTVEESSDNYEDLIDNFSGDTITNLLSEKSIEKMDKKQRETLLNQLIDNGLDKLTDSDKKLLILLTK